MNRVGWTDHRGIIVDSNVGKLCTGGAGTGVFAAACRGLDGGMPLGVMEAEPPTGCVEGIPSSRPRKGDSDGRCSAREASAGAGLVDRGGSFQVEEDGGSVAGKWGSGPRVGDTVDRNQEETSESFQEI